MRVDCVSDTVKHVNEDIARWDDTRGWVLDGATPLYPAELGSASGSDARWLVEQVDDLLQKKAGSSLDEPLQEVLRDVDAAVAERLGRHRNTSPSRLPSCSAGVIRLSERGLEYLVMGDISVVIDADGELETIVDTRVASLDALAAAELGKELARGKTHSEARDAILPLLQRHRALRNTADGYWVLTGDPPEVAHAVTGTVPVRERVRVLLASDGFARLVTTMGVASSWNELLDSCTTQPLQAMVDRLRAAERADERCERAPRLKPFDDASAIFMAAHR